MPSVRPATVRLGQTAKPDGCPRSLVTFYRDDAREYERAVAAVVLAVESVLGGEVLAERVRGRGSIGWTRPEPWRGARRRFERAVSQLGAPPSTVLLCTDVRDCYGSIHQPAVERSLRAIGCDRSDVVAVTRFLDRCEASGVRGLPVGPTPSAVLANAVLAALDRAIGVRAFRHLRWVDDLVIVAPNLEAASATLDDLRSSADELGLRLHDGKTRILTEAWSTLGTSRSGSNALA